MRTHAIFLILFLLVTESFGQMKYEKGYFITNDRERIECLIKNVDWNNNPKEFSYKLNESTDPEKGNLSLVREFGIGNDLKYIRASVRIDRSDRATGLGTQTNPMLTTERLFLKVLDDGKAKLYVYNSSYGRDFFYSVNDTVVKQLVHKRFMDGAAIVENNTYKDQLSEELSYPVSSLGNVTKIQYTAEDLKKYFNVYNHWQGDSVSATANQAKSRYFNLKFAPGVSSTAFSTSKVIGVPDLSSFKKNTRFRIGLEAELLLPFNKDKWGLVIEPTFQSYYFETKSELIHANYKSIEFPIGLRYYFYSNEKARFYLDGFYISNYAVNFNSKVEFYPFTNLIVAPSGSAAFGGGFEHKRLSIEARYYTDRNLFRNYRSFDAYYNRFSLILGYKLIYAKHK